MEWTSEQRLRVIAALADKASKSLTDARWIMKLIQCVALSHADNLNLNADSIRAFVDLSAYAEA